MNYLIQRKPQEPGQTVIHTKKVVNGLNLPTEPGQGVMLGWLDTWMVNWLDGGKAERRLGCWGWLNIWMVGW